jgi:hypothetical protein
MRYKKVKRIPFLANFPRSLVIRQQFALSMLDLLEQGFTVINIDESILNESNLRYRKWRT